MRRTKVIEGRLARAGRAAALIALALAALLAPPSSAQIGRTIHSLTYADEDKCDRQREIAGALARRHVGADFGGSRERDLDILQRLLDDGKVGPGDVFELQSLGVVLGDVMTRDFRGLGWVVVDDAYGRSRALRYKETEQLFFPVTMISKRVTRGDPADVRELYEKVAERIRELSKRSN